VTEATYSLCVHIGSPNHIEDNFRENNDDR